MSANFPSSSSRALILTRPSSPPRSPLPQLPSQENENWQPILHASNQVVLYNPHSHALTVASTSTNPPAALTIGRLTALTEPSTKIHPCPYCNQNLPDGFHPFAPKLPFRHSSNAHEDRWEPLVGQEAELESIDNDPAYHSRASDYFQLLAVVNDRSSQIVTPEPTTPVDDHGPGLERRNRGRPFSPSPEEYKTESGAFPADKMAEGYFKTFFQEECKLGMGASGTVFLCQVCPVFFFRSLILIRKVSTSLTEIH